MFIDLNHVSDAKLQYWHDHYTQSCNTLAQVYAWIMSQLTAEELYNCFSQEEINKIQENIIKYKSYMSRTSLKNNISGEIYIKANMANKLYQLVLAKFPQLNIFTDISDFKKWMLERLLIELKYYYKQKFDDLVNIIIKHININYMEVILTDLPKEYNNALIQLLHDNNCNTYDGFLQLPLSIQQNIIQKFKINIQYAFDEVIPSDQIDNNINEIIKKFINKYYNVLQSYDYIIIVNDYLFPHIPQWIENEIYMNDFVPGSKEYNNLINDIINDINETYELELNNNEKQILFKIIDKEIQDTYYA